MERQSEMNKILVVEDESIVALDLMYRLRGAGYLVTAIVATGEEAIIKARETAPDVVIMDIKLKGKLDGIQTAERILSFHPAAILYLSAYSDEATLARANRFPCVGYLIKPFELDDLDREIRKVALNFRDREMDRVSGKMAPAAHRPRQTGREARMRRRRLCDRTDPGLTFSFSS